MMINKISTTLNVRPDYLLGHIDEDVSLIKPELSKKSDLDTMLFMQNLDNALQKNAENTYIIHGAQGKGTVVKSENDKALLTGNGKTYELTQTEYEALEGVIKALRKENKN